jgi:heptosyltransferase III
MKTQKIINVFRRDIMKSLTKNIGKKNYNQADIKVTEIKRILISRPNHRLGNLLLLTPLVQEVINTFPYCRVDLFVKGNIAPLIFQNYTSVDRIIELPKKPFSNIFKYIKSWLVIRNRKYDLVINAIENSSSGKLSTHFSNATYKFFGEFNEESQLKYSDYKHNAKNTIYNLRNYLKPLEFDGTENKIPLLDIKLDKVEIAKGAYNLNTLVPESKKTICLFTNATGDKCYSETWWTEFYEKLKLEFTDFNIIELLPIENISRLGYEIPAFYTKDIREMGALIANTNLFIAADSGVMHLASAVGTSTIGLFSVTDENVYKPYGNKSLSINTNKVSITEMVDLINIYLKNPFPKKSR